MTVSAHPEWLSAGLSSATPNLDEPTISGEGVETVVAVIKTLPYLSQPRICVASISDFSGTPANVPFYLRPFYNWQNKLPHAEKRKMTKAIVGAAGEGLIDSVSIVEAKRKRKLSDETVRLVGVEYGRNVDESVRRAKVADDTVGTSDVGGWIVKNLVQGGDGPWEVSKGGKTVALTC